MKMRSTALMHTAKIGYIVMSAVFCLVGLIFVIRPADSVAFLGYLLGISLIVFGAIKIIGYFSRDLYRLAFQYDLEFGIVLMIVGAIAAAKPNETVNFIFIATGMAILLDSLFKMRIATDAKRFGVGAWWSIMLFAVLTGIIGAILIICPWSGAEALTVLLGVSLLCEGVLNLCVAVSTVKIIKNQYPDVIEADFCETEDDQR